MVPLVRRGTGVCAALARMVFAAKGGMCFFDLFLSVLKFVIGLVHIFNSKDNFCHKAKGIIDYKE